MNEIRFEMAQPEDEAKVRELLITSGLPDEDIAPHFKQFIVAKFRTEPVGCVGLEISGDCALLRSLAVVPSRRSRGLAAELCARLEESARSRGFRTLYLLTTTAADYFSRRGYQRVERTAAPAAIRATRQFTDLCPSTAVLMKIEL